VAVVEQVGEASFAYVELSDARDGLLVARLDADTRVRRGDRLALDAAPQHLHVFDASGRACPDAAAQ
jgi:multiple sugar transport system ATP-binding protein